MSAYEINVANKAEHQIKKLPQGVRKRVLAAVEKLAETPRPHGVEKLSQDPRFWRLRVGDYRVIYAIDEDTSLIMVAVVRHRKDAYRNLDLMDPRMIAEAIERCSVSSHKA